MTRYFIAVAAGLFLASAGFAQDKAKTITLRWFGQSYYQVVASNGTRVVFDPHAIMTYPRVISRADIVVITHPHQDHSQLDVIENKESAKVFHGVKGVGRKQEWVVVDETVRDIKIRSVPLFHDKSSGMERGKNAGFIVEIDGLRFVHLGDLGHELTDAQVKAIGAVDVLMIPVGGSYTINGSDAKSVVNQLKPRRLILPMHYGTKDFDELVGPEEFLDEQMNVQKLLNTNELMIDPMAKAPEAPTIILMGWKKDQ